MAALRADTLFSGVMGERLHNAYCSVKEDELAYFSEMSFEQEVALLEEKGF